MTTGEWLLLGLVIAVYFGPYVVTLVREWRKDDHE